MTACINYILHIIKIQSILNLLWEKNYLVSKDIVNFYHEPSTMTYISYNKEWDENSPCPWWAYKWQGKRKADGNEKENCRPEYTGRTFNLQKGRGTSGMPCGTWRVIGVCQAKQTNENSWQKSSLEDSQGIWGYEINSTRLRWHVWRGVRGVTGDICRVHIRKGP